MMNKIKRSVKNMPLYRYGVAPKRKINRDAFEAVLKLALELREKGVALAFILPPDGTRIKGLTEFEKYRIEHWVFNFNNLSSKEMELISRTYGDVSTEYVKQIYDGAKVIMRGGHRIMADFHSPLVNISNGIRSTYHQPTEYKNKICMFGACTIRGTGVEDGHTIASFLQDDLNREGHSRYCVFNYGVGCGSSIYDEIYHARRVVFYSRDIVLLSHHWEPSMLDFCRKNNIPVLDTTQYFHRPHDYREWFTDETYHTNRYGNEIIAQKIRDSLPEILASVKDVPVSGSEAPVLLDDANLHEFENNADFQLFIDSLASYLPQDYKSATCAGIVMNCNPFTLGHRYLIQTAAEQTDYLFIFVVEEDRSFFPFADRLQLVREGTADFPNVTVLPSGKFIISALTFPGYFLKEDDKSAVVDTSLDIDLFGRFIAPAMNITIRFVGEEPFDPITRQYNETMKAILPSCGIEVREIPRIEENDSAISASRVRHYLKNEDWSNITALVPPTTLRYLEACFKSGHGQGDSENG